MMKSRVTALALALTAIACAAALGLATGCKDKKKKADEIISLEGKVEKVAPDPDGATGRITVSYRDQHDQEMVGTGEVTKETEIMINGALAKLSDVKQGDRGRGDVRIIKQGKEQKRLVLKFNIDRPTATKPEGSAGP